MKVSDCIVDFPYRFQLRCVLKVPIVVLQPNTLLQGSLRMIAHERQSYDVHVSLEGPPVQFGMPEQKVSGNIPPNSLLLRLAVSSFAVGPMYALQM